MRIDEPGAIGFVKLSIGNFADVVGAARTLADTPGSVVRTPFGVLACGYEMARTILRDQRFISLFSAAAAIDVGEVPESPNEPPLLALRRQTGRRPRPNVLATEGEDHHRLRRLVAGAFTPAAADRLRPFMRSHVVDLIDSITATDGGELVERLCRPYPVPVICELMGVDATDWKLFDRWAELILGALDANVEAVMERAGDIIAAQAELADYVTALVAERRRSPGDDMISALIEAQDDGDRLNGDELTAMVEALLLAGTDTTRNQLGGTLAVLADHPEQYQLLRRDPSLVPAAIEESLRYVAAVRSTARVATEDVTLDGLTFPAGTTVIVGLHAASLEPPDGAADDTFRFDITAERARPHLAFGSGIHHCLGAFLARAELQEALAAFAERVEAFNLSAPVEWKPLSMGIWGPSRLEIAIDRQAPAQFSAGTVAGTVADAASQNDETTRQSTSQPANQPANQPASTHTQADEAARDRHLTDTAPIRTAIKRRTKTLLTPKRLPPLGRMAVTAALVGAALAVGKAVDRRLSHEERRARTYRRLRRAAERLGPAYIKLAQLIAAGEGVFPDALVDECRLCVDRVRAEPWGRIRKVIEAELGPLSRTFSAVATEPIAAASIAQVHKATLRDGTPVVIKVQRPHIRRRVERDIAVLAWAAPKLVGRIPITALANPPALVELFAETIGEELDFRVEVANLIEVDRALTTVADGRIQRRWRLPQPYLSDVTERVIVMSPVDGQPMSSLEPHALDEGEAGAIFTQMSSALLEGACVHGVFHGDFHAGNVFVAPDGDLGLVDFGITGRLSGAQRVAFMRYVVGLLTGDVEAQLGGLAALGAFKPDTDIAGLISDLRLDRQDFDPLELSEEEFVAEFRELVQGLLTHDARIPKELMLFIKNFAYMTSVLGAIDPEMDILGEFQRSATGFFARNGVQMASEIGYAPDPTDVTEDALRQAMGVSRNERDVNWKLLRRRRRLFSDRVSTASPAVNQSADQPATEPPDEPPDEPADPQVR